MQPTLIGLAEQLGEHLKANRLIIATAESCTGGWIGETITAIPGSSAWFDRGFITYSNAAKIQMLGVNPETLRDYGAVSAQVASEMAAGALLHSDANLVVAVTGVAGPGGGTSATPVGTVFIAWQQREGELSVEKNCFFGERQQIRAQTVMTAIKGFFRFKSI